MASLNIHGIVSAKPGGSGFGRAFACISSTVDGARIRTPWSWPLLATIWANRE